MGLNGIREKLRPFYSETDRPSIDPELMTPDVLIGYCTGTRLSALKRGLAKIGHLGGTASILDCMASFLGFAAFNA